MAAITPKYIQTFQTQMQHLAAEDYFAAADELWVNDVATVLPVTTGHTVLTWLLNTAEIKRQGEMGGVRQFGDLVSAKLEFDIATATDGFEIHRHQLEDTDTGPVALNLASERVAQWGQWMAYWPQLETYRLLAGGTTEAYLAYDGLPFFSATHRLNAARSAGTFSNICGSGVGAGLLPIHEKGTGAVSLDVAVQNLGTMGAYVRSLKAANGLTPRGLRIDKVLAGPVLYPRVVQATQAKFLATTAGASGSVGGSADYDARIGALGLGKPIQVDEFTDSIWETSYIVTCKRIGKRRIGPVIYAEREGFRINQYTPNDLANLDEMERFKWHLKGRNAVVPGHFDLAFLVRGVA